MKKELLKILACPSSAAGKRCGGCLALASHPPPRCDLSSAEEIIEALLECQTCGLSYPVLCGVAIVFPGVAAYLQRNYKIILRIAVESDLGISAPMREYLQKTGAHIEAADRGGRGGSDDDPRTLSSYLNAHFDPRSSLLERLPKGHPLAVFLRQYRAADLYHVLIEMLRPRLKPGGRALDIGCHVGRLTRDLAALDQRVVGIDLSFPAVFLARQAVCGWPRPLDSYEHFRDGLLRETRTLNLPPFPHAEVLVASATALPFPAESFDVTASANVVDILPDPIALLREMRFVLATDGLMALSTPYHRGAIQAAGQWLGTEGRMSPAQALRWRIGHHFEILEERDDVPWVLGEHERHLQIYLNHCMIGRKAAAEGGQ